MDDNIYNSAFELWVADLNQFIPMWAIGVILYLTFLYYAPKTTMLLTVIYGARSAFSAYSLMDISTFQAVPYLLPCLLVTFYLLGRAGWDWP